MKHQLSKLITNAFCLTVTLFASTAAADSVALRFENDCLFRRTLANQDNDYTHGTGLEYWYKDEWKFTIQQNMYTPNDICAYEHVEGDRPYAGWLGASVGKILFADPKSPWSHFVDVRFGMIGPSAKAGEVQKAVHRALGCREPNGWQNQLADEFCINAEWWTKYNWYICDYVALIPRAGVLVGNIQDAAEIGTDLKIGWNIRKQKDTGNNNMFSAPGPDYQKQGNSFWDHLVFYIFAGVDGRAYLYNHFYEGSLFNRNDRGLGVDIKPFVGEVQFGAYLEIYGVFVKWYGNLRTHEFYGQDRPADYGGLYFGYRWSY